MIVAPSWAGELALNVIPPSLQQSRGLLDGLLDISRLVAHAVQIPLVPHDMGAVLEAVREEYAALAALRGLRLAVDAGAVGRIAAPWALTDVDQLLRIFAQGFRADVLVVDFRLHDETGADVIARLRKCHGEISVVIVTGRHGSRASA